MEVEVRHDRQRGLEHLGELHTVLHRSPPECGIIGYYRDVQVTVSFYRFVYFHCLAVFPYGSLHLSCCRPMAHFVHHRLTRGGLSALFGLGVYLLDSLLLYFRSSFVSCRFYICSFVCLHLYSSHHRIIASSHYRIIVSSHHRNPFTTGLAATYSFR